MPEVTHHGRTTAFTRTDRGGDGPPVLCIHGAGGARGVWKSQSRLGDRWPVISLDLSGHGESDDVNAEAGYETLSAYVDDAVAVARETEARVLVGSSLGGAVALAFALERDYSLDGLVLAGTGARLAVLDDLLTWLDDDFDRAVEFLHAPDRLFHDADERYVDLSRETMYETGQAVTRRDFRTSHAFDVRDSVADVGAPTLAVVGEYDQLTPPWYHEELAALLPDCEMRELPDAAHLAMLERPEAFNDAVAAFLEDAA